jgi:hypothetical protein
MSGWSKDPNFWVGQLHQETDIKKMNLEVCNCLFGHDYGPRFWHAWLQLHGMVYNKIDMTDRYYVSEMNGTHHEEENYGIWYRGLDRIQIVVSISEKNNDYLHVANGPASKYLYLRGAQEFPAIYFYLDGHKTCQWNAVEKELFQAIEAAVNPKLLPLCISMVWAKDLAARYMEMT